MSIKINLVVYDVNFARSDWNYPLDYNALQGEVNVMGEQFSALGVHVDFSRDPSFTIEVKGYADLLNAVRIRSNRPGLSNLCLGHVIGCSEQLDLMDDIRKGIRRVAFAPETIEPEGSDKVVCHNCGCGC